jgi:hypothetical protein
MHASHAFVYKYFPNPLTKMRAETRIISTCTQVQGLHVMLRVRVKLGQHECVHSECYLWASAAAYVFA